MSVVLDVVVREETGTGNAREARRNGVVPGVVYGGDKDAISIGIKYNEVLKAINSGQFLSNMVELKHDGKLQKAITKDVQFHPCLLYTSPSPRDKRQSRMPSSA